MNYRYIFLKQILKSFNTTGAIAPSSKTLAKAVTSALSGKKGPIKVLEVGAGTGALTQIIIKQLGIDDHIDICEINHDFIKSLNNRLKKDKNFINFKGHLRILPIEVQKIEGRELYDVIISGLPLNAFEPLMVQEIFNTYLRLVKPWGRISYFEYIGVKHLKSLISSKKEKERLSALAKIQKNFIHHNQLFKETIWPNIPPAYVRHCQKRV